MVMSWSEFSSGSESSASEGESVGCSVGTKWWRTMTMIASEGNFDLLLRLDRVGTSVDSMDLGIALRVVL